MLVPAVQILVLGLLVLPGQAASLPSSAIAATGQVVLADSLKGGRRYENGELPPMENTLGWVDPRLNGGRFIDVRCPILTFSLLIRTFYFP